MMRYVHWLAPLVATGVAIYLVVLLVQVNRPVALPDTQLPASPQEHAAPLREADNGWLNALAQSERKGYFYPVNEIYIEVDLNQKLVHEKIYRLSAKLRDPYQLFCLKQELKQHGLRYTLEKEKDGAQLLVYSKEQSKLTALVNALENYQITASYLPYQEDQRWKNIK